MKTFVLIFIASILAINVHAYTEENVLTPVNDGESIPLHLWLPDDIAASTNGRLLPLVVISHGAGGSSEDFEDTSQALANAGFIVAAVMHPGNNYRDNSYVHLGMNLISRPRHISHTIDYMLTTWHAHAQIDPARIGIFGFSAGGFTALVIAGGKADLSLTEQHCRTEPDAWDCIYLCKNGAPTKRSPMPANVHDARVRAAVIAAPAVAYSFEPNGLANVHVPMQLWSGERDMVVKDSAALVQRLLPVAPEYHVVANANHFSFMRPCDWKLHAIISVLTWFGTSDICADPEGFDRERFHEEFNRSVVRFFSTQL